MFVESRARSSFPNSEWSEAPVDNGIRKKIEFQISFGGRRPQETASAWPAWPSSAHEQDREKQPGDEV